MKKLVLVLGFMLVCPCARAQVWTAPMDAAKWTVWYKDMSFAPTQGTGSMSFAFPSTTWCGTPGTAGSDCGENYGAFTIDYAAKKSLSISGTLTATLQVQTAPANPLIPVSFDWETEADNTCFTTPATTRFYIQEWVNSPNVALTRRWYSKSAYVLQDSGGIVTLAVPLLVEDWQDVYNDGNAKGFAATLANVNRIGFVAGGGCFFGHGVSVSGGSATFKLVSFGTQ